MRFLLVLLCSLPVFVFGQQQLPAEDSICRCLERRFAEQGVDLAAAFDAFETDLIERAYLDAAGERYGLLLRDIAEADYYDLRRSRELSRVDTLFADAFNDCYQKSLFRYTDEVLGAKVTQIVTDYAVVDDRDSKTMQREILAIYLRRLERADFQKKLYRWLVLWNLFILAEADTSDIPAKFPEEKITLPDDRLLPVFASREGELVVGGEGMTWAEFKPVLVETFRQQNGVKLISQRETNYAFYLEVYRFIKSTHGELLDRAAAKFDKIYEQLPRATQYAIRQELPFVLVEVTR
jgi:hypothetical protein